MGSRRKARECALQMLFAADVAGTRGDQLARMFWSELSDGEVEPGAQEFATALAMGALAHLDEVDEKIRSRAEHWRISRMALVDRNLLRLAVYEFLHEPTPRTVIINDGHRLRTQLDVDPDVALSRIVSLALTPKSALSY